MTIVQAAILGAIQGLTEFFPVSSSGHLVLAEYYLGLVLDPRSMMGFDVLLHGGTLLALLLVYRRRWTDVLCAPLRRDKKNGKLLLWLILATVPGALAGLFLEDFIALQLRSPLAVACALLGTAAVLVAGERIAAMRTRAVVADAASVGLGRAMLIGLAQACALVPGVSRSGLTVSMGRAVGLERIAALDFSFLLAVPIIGGALAKTVLDALSGEVVFPSAMVAATGFVVSFVVSIIAMFTLRRIVSKYGLAWFAWYLVPLAGLLLYDVLGIRDTWDPARLPDYVQSYGAIAVFFFAFMEVVPPLSFVSPGVFALLVAGSLIETPVHAALFCLAAVAGAGGGNMVLFWLGRRYGLTWADRLHLRGRRLERAELFARKFGRLSVFIGQFISVVRPAIAFLSGTLHLPFKRYASWMGSSVLLWAVCWIGAGWMLRESVAVGLGVVAAGGTVILLCVAAGSLVEVWILRRKKRRKSGE